LCAATLGAEFFSSIYPLLRALSFVITADAIVPLACYAFAQKFENPDDIAPIVDYFRPLFALDSSAFFAFLSYSFFYFSISLASFLALFSSFLRFFSAASASSYNIFIFSSSV